MVENLFKLACLMFSSTIAFTYLIVSFENQASATSTKVKSAVYTTVSESTTVTRKKKNCNCCAERMERGRQLMERRRKMVQQAQKRARTEQPPTNVSMAQ
ncbi:MAG: hypothetical protein OXU36_08250 [Candidatus Poribacteria bacterium]|nr:hypothetical protein [Candidatus Poribacteria bacterium]